MSDAASNTSVDDLCHGQLLDERSRHAYEKSVAETEIACAEQEISRASDAANEAEKTGGSKSTETEVSVSSSSNAHKEVAAEVVGQTSPWVQLAQTGAATLSAKSTNPSSAKDVAAGKKSGFISPVAASPEDVFAKLKIENAHLSANDGHGGFESTNKLTKDMSEVNKASTLKSTVAEVVASASGKIRTTYATQEAHKELVQAIDHRLATTPSPTAAPSAMPAPAGMGGGGQTIVTAAPAPYLSLENGPKFNMKDEDIA